MAVMNRSSVRRPIGNLPATPVIDPYRSTLRTVFRVRDTNIISRAYLDCDSYGVTRAVSSLHDIGESQTGRLTTERLVEGTKRIRIVAGKDPSVLTSNGPKPPATHLISPEGAQGCLGTSAIGRRSET